MRSALPGGGPWRGRRCSPSVRCAATSAGEPLGEQRGAIGVSDGGRNSCAPLGGGSWRGTRCSPSMGCAATSAGETLGEQRGAIGVLVGGRNSCAPESRQASSEELLEFRSGAETPAHPSFVSLQNSATNPYFYTIGRGIYKTIRTFVRYALLGD